MVAKHADIHLGTEIEEGKGEGFWSLWFDISDGLLAPGRLWRYRWARVYI